MWCHMVPTSLRGLSMPAPYTAHVQPLDRVIDCPKAVEGLIGHHFKSRITVDTTNLNMSVIKGSEEK